MTRLFDHTLPAASNPATAGFLDDIAAYFWGEDSARSELDSQRRADYIRLAELLKKRDEEEAAERGAEEKEFRAGYIKAVKFLEKRDKEEAEERQKEENEFRAGYIKAVEFLKKQDKEEAKRGSWGGA